MLRPWTCHRVSWDWTRSTERSSAPSGCAAGIGRHQIVKVVCSSTLQLNGPSPHPAGHGRELRAPSVRCAKPPDLAHVLTEARGRKGNGAPPVLAPTKERAMTMKSRLGGGMNAIARNEKDSRNRTRPPRVLFGRRPTALMRKGRLTFLGIGLL